MSTACRISGHSTGVSTYLEDVDATELDHLRPADAVVHHPLVGVVEWRPSAVCVRLSHMHSRTALHCTRAPILTPTSTKRQYE